MTPDDRPPRRGILHRVVYHQPMPRACRPATDGEGSRGVQATTKDSWRSLATATPAAGSFVLLLSVADLTTAVPVAGSIFVVTAMVINWFIPRAKTRKMHLEDVRQGFWLVQRRRGPTITVAEVIVSSRDNTRTAEPIKLALRDGEDVGGKPEDSVWIAELRDPYKRWRPPRTDPPTALRDLSMVKRLLNEVHDARPHGDVCSCASNRRSLTEWATRHGWTDPAVLLDYAIGLGMLREQDGEIDLTPAGHVFLDDRTTPNRPPESAANQSRGGITINDSPGLTVFQGWSTWSQTGYLPPMSDDERIVRKLLDKIADNHKTLEQDLPDPHIGQVSVQTQVLNDAISSGDLHTSKVKKALDALLDIARQLPSGIISGTIVEVIKEAIKHFFG